MAGYSPYSLIAAGTTNATLVQGHASELHGGYLYNSAAYAVFLKLYNSATAPTAGAGTPVLRLGIPAATAVAISSLDSEGVSFNLGLGFTITKLSADNDTTVVVAGDLLVNLFYR
jgi:hypothetical protein